MTQVFRSRRANWLFGLTVGNALIGMSFGWWVPKHNAHHALPNQVDRDPDMGDGLVVFTSTTGLPGSTATSHSYWRAGRPGFSSYSRSSEVRACMCPLSRGCSGNEIVPRPWKAC